MIAQDIQYLGVSDELRRKYAKNGLDSTDDESYNRTSRLRTSHDPLMEKLFGKMAYRYQLQLEEAIPEVLYKEKNFDVRVKLIDLENSKVMNCNALNLCFAVCDANGEWISESKSR